MTGAAPWFKALSSKRTSWRPPAGLVCRRLQCERPAGLPWNRRASASVGVRVAHSPCRRAADAAVGFLVDVVTWQVRLQRLSLSSHLLAWLFCASVELAHLARQRVQVIVDCLVEQDLREPSVCPP